MELLQHIKQLLEYKNQIYIAIDGPCASGKTSFAKKLSDKLDATLIHMDDYFLPPELKVTKRMQEIGGNIHYERIIDELFSDLEQSVIHHRKFNCSSNQFEQIQSVKLKPIVILEGVYSLHPKLRHHFDVKVLLTIDEETQKERLIARSGIQLYQRFVTEWIPLEQRYFNNEDFEQIADYTLDTTRVSI